METTHRVYYSDARNMKNVVSESVDLMLTSPPYPMIEMWDAIFAAQDPKIKRAVEKEEADRMFELMHRVLDKVWEEVWRVLKQGAIACINIGDAVRTVGGRFSLFTNHTRIQSQMLKLGFSSLPSILWRKQTNAPNKFMGSGMLPPGAYVTLEHEYILLFRKGDKRKFHSETERQARRESAYFWEERNKWFSDVWMDLKGAGQVLVENARRARSGSFPFELAYRIVNMFSVKKDIVLDPFIGAGGAMLAAIACGRNSVGYEIDSSLKDSVSLNLSEIISVAGKRNRKRLVDHVSFINERLCQKRFLKHQNRRYGFPVMTSQEKELFITTPESIEEIQDNYYRARHSEQPMEGFLGE